jgi:hypothetical protein
MVKLAWVQAEAGAGVGLWIEVDNQTRRPNSAKHAPRLTVVVVFPTPPF